MKIAFKNGKDRVYHKMVALTMNAILHNLSLAVVCQLAIRIIFVIGECIMQ